MCRGLLKLGLTVLLAMAIAAGLRAQKPDDPFPLPIPAEEGAIRVNLAEFAALPDIDGVAARMMLLVDEPGTRRLFVNDMRGPIYTVSYDGKTVTPYLDINASHVGRARAVDGRERGVPELRAAPAVRTARLAGLRQALRVDGHEQHDAGAGLPAGGRQHHAPHARHRAARIHREDAGGRQYDGGPPRELMRLRQPFANHNAGQLAFNANAAPGSPDYGLLFVGVADGGSGGDPLRMAQNMGNIFGKILRITISI